jgi:hypothetical protein
MNYICIKGVVTSNGPKAVGDIVGPLPPFEAHILMSQGKIAPYEEREEIVAAEAPAFEHRDPKPRGRPRKDR